LGTAATPVVTAAPAPRISAHAPAAHTIGVGCRAPPAHHRLGGPCQTESHGRSSPVRRWRLDEHHRTWHGRHV